MTEKIKILVEIIFKQFKKFLILVEFYAWLKKDFHQSLSLLFKAVLQRLFLLLHCFIS